MDFSSPLFDSCFKTVLHTFFLHRLAFNWFRRMSTTDAITMTRPACVLSRTNCRLIHWLFRNYLLLALQKKGNPESRRDPPTQGAMTETRYHRSRCVSELSTDSDAFQGSRGRHDGKGDAEARRLGNLSQSVSGPAVYIVVWSLPQALSFLIVLMTLLIRLGKFIHYDIKTF